MATPENPAFQVRALEMHGHNMWIESRVLQALDFIKRHGMNALVFHSNDVIHQLVFPRGLFPFHDRWTFAPPRRGENAIFNNRVYIENVIRLSHQYGADFYLEVKELAFPDELLEVRPQLVKNGTVCPTDPTWAEFLEMKYDELFQDFPGLAGVVVSAGSPEGRAALSQRKCQCDSCRSTDTASWYRMIIESIYRATSKHKKVLAIREFSYRAEQQYAIVEALEQLPSDIVFCVKSYPHDFYPTFPDNTAFEELPDNPKWMEYDVHGQYYGWGVFPCLVSEDLKRRVRHARNHGASGGLFRTDWERINDLSCFDTLNRLNLVVAAALAIDPSSDVREIVRRGLLSEGFVTNPDSTAPVAAVLERLWPVLRKALYTGRFVLNSSSMFPNGIEHGWWTMFTKHSLHEWEPEAKRELDLNQPGRVEQFLQDKDDALSEIRSVVHELQSLGSALRTPDHLRMGDPWALYERYVEGFVLAGKAVVLGKALQVAVEDHQRREWAERLQSVIDELNDYHRSLVDWRRQTVYGHQVYMLLDPDRVGHVLEEARSILATAR